jgi:L-aspartate oxidase
MIHTDILIIGSGIAGCAAAHAAAKDGVKVLLLTKTLQAEESNTFYAQGGIIYQGENDAPARLASDIRTAGAGLCYEPAIKVLSEEGPKLVRKILIDELQVPFDVADEASDEFDLTAEAAHSVRRILHYKDTTGRAIETAFLNSLQRNPNVELLTNGTAIDLLTLSHHSLNRLDIYQPPTCVGAYVLLNETGEVETVFAKETILATGGLGRVFLHTTNPVHQHAVRAIPSHNAVPPVRTVSDFRVTARGRRPAGNTARRGVYEAVPSGRVSRAPRCGGPRDPSVDD